MWVLINEQDFLEAIRAAHDVRTFGIFGDRDVLVTEYAAAGADCPFLKTVDLPAGDGHTRGYYQWTDGA